MSQSEFLHRDLYKESFKYFRNFSSSSLSQRKIKRKKSLKRKGNDNDSLISISTNGNSEVNPTLSSEDEDVYRHQLPPSENDILLKYPDQAHSAKDDLITREINYDPTQHCECYKMWGLRPPETWRVKELTFPAGLIVIKNPFTAAGQRFWISRTMIDFPHHPEYITNMDNLNRLERMKGGATIDKLEDFKLDTCGRDFYQTLRWVTFGYHHDWDTKVYTEERRSEFPLDLADMTRYISQILGFSGFEAEAAIANYYHMDSTLSGHVDRSEVNQYAPLFSMSFGQSCIFLIGGKTKGECPQAVLLQSGDMAIMSGESRLSYHGVPAILPASSKPWDVDITGPTEHICSIPNPVVKKQKLDSKTPSPPPLIHHCETFQASLKDANAQKNLENTKWSNFLKKYISKSRINLNIRQVLFPGQSGLSDNVQK